MRIMAKLLAAWFVAIAVVVAPLAAMAAPLGVDVAVLNGPPCAFPGSAIDLNLQLNAATLNCHQAGLATGQLTITRTTSGYVQYNNNCLVSIPSGAFRISDKGLLVEEARTNDDLWSRDMTNAAWVKVNVTTSQNATGADCLANTATQLTATAGNATVLQTITLGSQADTYDVWLQRVSGTGNIQITADGSTWTTETLTTAWQMFQVTQTLANPVSGIRIVTSGDVINADFNKLEPGGFATSPIVTTTVPVTRNADLITLNSPSVAPAVGTVLTYTLLPFSTGGAAKRMQAWAVGGETGLARLTVRAADTSTPGPAFVVGTGAANNALSDVDVAGGTIAKMAGAWDASTFAFAMQGRAAKTNNAAGWSAQALGFNIGSVTGPGNFLNGYAERFVLWNQKLSTSQLSIITQ